MSDVAAMPDVDVLWRMYQQEGSVHRVGSMLGATGDTVWARLRKAGYKLQKSNWSVEETAALRAYYADTPALDFDLKTFAASLGRPYYGVAIRAGRLGLGNPHRGQSSATVDKMRSRMREQWKSQPHPRGMAGKKHTPEVCARMAMVSRERWEIAKATDTGLMAPEVRQKRSDSMAHQQRTNPRLRAGYSRGKQGRRPDLGGIFFRSSWEANYARYLEMLRQDGKIGGWQFEPETFWFLEIKRGVRSYLPDFKIARTGGRSSYFVEVKGWMDPKSATKISRMRKYYPDVELEVVDQKRYRLIEARYGDKIPGWESGSRASLGARSVAPPPCSMPRPAWLH
jgi:hypothetical protein